MTELIRYSGKVVQLLEDADILYLAIPPGGQSIILTCGVGGKSIGLSKSSLKHLAEELSLYADIMEEVR